MRFVRRWDAVMCPIFIIFAVKKEKKDYVLHP